MRLGSTQLLVVAIFASAVAPMPFNRFELERDVNDASTTASDGTTAAAATATDSPLPFPMNTHSGSPDAAIAL
ncbi:hypothetical protein EXIGLDRAFT_758839 [Exidia glandulosa HHB12029]|uniref:Uncharacterized protein n=1 Tax=Exidia glandulosa HHB12029 TaxID=1314781 RepID=A0A165QEE4_EXIGL|nr:hypothetical protein EXIGLDRAFT_758839 [Exidia glandulosa HHB12029]